MKNFTRRDFLKTAALGAAAFSIGARSWSRAAGANGDIRVGQIGFHGQGGSHIQSLSRLKGVRLVALCDVDRHVLDHKAQQLGGGIATYTDIRKLAREQGSGRGFDRRAQPLACAGHRLGLPGRQRRLCREAGLPQFV